MTSNADADNDTRIPRAKYSTKGADRAVVLIGSMGFAEVVTSAGMVNGVHTLSFEDALLSWTWLEWNDLGQQWIGAGKIWVRLLALLFHLRRLISILSQKHLL